MKSPSQLAHRSIRPRPGLIVALLAGVFGAALALGQTAASLGLGLEPFRPLGGSFFSYKAGQAKFLQQMHTEADAASVREALPFARNILQNAPLSARAAWLVGVSFDAAGDQERARAIVSQAAQISRRESLPQSWLAQQALEDGDARGAMSHFDTILRTQPELKPQLLPRMSGLLAAPEGVALFRDYANARTEWYSDFLKAAAEAQTDARPLARFLLARDVYLPDDRVADEAYRLTLQRLSQANEYRTMALLYPKLPGSRGRHLGNLSFASTSDGALYPPLDWELVQAADRNAAPVTLGRGSVGLELSSGAGLTGVLARKLVAAPPGAAVGFDLVERTANDGSTAFWRATCVQNSVARPVSRSGDLFTGPPVRRVRFDLPAGCPLVLLEFVMSGGIGREDARVLIKDVALLDAAKRTT